MMNKAVFLDRDGTINAEKEYLHKIEEFELLHGAAQAISKMNQLGYVVVVITNQSGIARGYYAESEMHALNAHMARLLSMENAHIDAIYFCPHHPEAMILQYRKDCDCRKPKPGLFKRAISELGIDIKRSWAVGDRVRDIVPAKELGMKTALVLTGHGASEDPQAADVVVASLEEFVGLLE